MASAVNEFFQEHTAIRKIVLAQSNHGVEGLGQHFRVVAGLHANAATTRRAFEHDRVTDRLCSTQRFIERGQQAGTRHQRQSVLLGQRARPMLERKGFHA